MNALRTYRIPEIKGKCVLVTPLDWGLGHATRCVPIIWELKERGHKVILAASGAAYAFLKQEFPSLQLIKIPGIHIRYSNDKDQLGQLLKQVPRALYSTYKEYQAIQRIVGKYEVSTIISDNRFGCFSSNAHCVYMTHQLHIKLPKGMGAFEPIASFIHQLIVDRYDACWIPDYKDESICLSGKLSHEVSLPHHTTYIGPLSRFSVCSSHILLEEDKELVETPFDALAVISGPEPQRSLFEKKLRLKFEKKGYNALIVQGKPKKKKHTRVVKNGITSVSHLASPTLAHLITRIPRIYCRSGYSTIMDMHVLNSKAYYYPTPGQSEQEYLADYLKKRFK